MLSSLPVPDLTLIVPPADVPYFLYKGIKVHVWRQGGDVVITRENSGLSHIVDPKFRDKGMWLYAIDDATGTGNVWDDSISTLIKQIKHYFKTAPDILQKSS